MAQVGDSAHTDHGLGQITEVIKERGRSSFRVAGRGFTVWVDETKLHLAGEGGDENLFAYNQHVQQQSCPPYGYDSGDDGGSEHHGGLEVTIDPGTHDILDGTTLPYDYTPQYPVDMFRHEQTIQPGENEIDPAKRLHPSDSVSGSQRTDVKGPQPSSGLFAAPGSENLFADERTSAQHDSPYVSWQGNEPGRHGVPEGPRHAKPPTRNVPMGDEEYEAYMADDPRTSGGRHETWPMDKGEGGPGHYPSGGNFRPAGLSDRYAQFELEATDNDSPVAQFRRDPLGFLRTCGHLWTDGDDSMEKFAAETQLIDADPLFREAAWTDVRRKAMRLRHEGRVHVNDHGAGRIYATVEGDNGTYDVMIVKGGSYGGLGGGQSVTDWACSCPWGRWAFKRQMSYVGRLCSHGYATYLDMQSRDIGPEHFKKSAGVDDYKQWLEDNDQVPEAASIASYLNTTALNLGNDDVRKLYDYAGENYAESPERDFKTPYTNDPDEAYVGGDRKKKADRLLRTRPQSLTPDLRAVPEGEDQVWTDVESDDRETTGPDDIVHFSSHDTLRRLHAEATGNGTGGTMLPDTSTTDPTGGPSTASPSVAPPVQPTPGTTTTGVTPGLNTIQMASYSQIMASLHRTADTTTMTPYGGGGGTVDVPKWNLPKKLFHSDEPGAERDPNDPTKNVTPSGGTVIPAGGVPNTSGGRPPTGVGGMPTGPTGAQQAEHQGKPPPVGVVPQPGQPTAPGQAPGTPTAAPAPAAPGGNAPWKASPGLDAEGKNAINNDEYEIQSGDTLTTIAERAYGKDAAPDKVQELVKANSGGGPGYANITNPDLIYAGDKIKVPGASTTDSLTGKPTPTDAQGVNTQAGIPTNEPGGGGNPAENRAADAANIAPLDNSKLPAAPAPAAPPAPGAPPVVKTQSRHGSWRYAETSDAGLLDKLRDMSSTPAADDLGHMDSRNDELRDLVDELNDRGYDASFMVAALDLRAAERNEQDPTEASPSFLGLSGPDWADEGFHGSGPTPKDWISDSAGYVEENELPHHVKDWAEDDGEDIIKFNDSRSKPQQGPGHSSALDFTARLHYADDTGEEEEHEGKGMFNPDNPHEQGRIDDLGGQLVDQLGEVGGHLPGGGGGGLSDLLGLGGEGGGGAAAGEAAAGGGELAELAPLLLAARAGHGPINPPRIDPGFRQPDRPRYAAAPPQDFGFDGAPDEASYLNTPDGGGDIVAAFQRSGAAAAVMSENSSSSNDDIARHAQAFLRTAGRKYSPEEQRELEAEFHPQGARNLPTDDDLEGTHYLLGL